MSDDCALDRLLEQAIAEGLTPEQVCADASELLPELRRRWLECRSLSLELDSWFPSGEPQEAETVGGEGSLPVVPGYELYEVLGRGGMGIVYRGRHLRLDRQIALKMMRPGVYAGPVERKRFEREAQIIASLCHPHIVQVFDVGDVSGRPFYSMEFISGGSLARRLTGAPQPIRNSADLISKLADAIDLAHRNGTIHRDIKPGNVLLASNGIAKISDFGLAFQADREADLAFSKRRFGTPSYMAPEQALGETSSIGPAVDIYSLGAVLHELLTGHPPVQADTSGNRQHSAADDDRLPRPRLDSRIPRDLRAICLKCLEREPRRRYRTAGELSEDLQRFLNYLPVLARPVTHWRRVRGWIQRNRLTSAALLIAGLLLGLLFVGSIWSAAHFRNLAQDNGVLATDNGKLAQRYESERDKAISAEQRENGLRHNSENLAAAHRKDLYVAEMTLAAQASRNVGGIARVNELLGHWEQSKPDLRDWEWYYLNSLCHRDLQTYRLHLRGATSVSWNPDGTKFASSGTDRTICIVDRTQATPVKRWVGHEREIMSVAWSHDGTRLASASWDHKVKIWDSSSGQLIRICQGHTAEVYCIEWSPDDRLLASGGKDRIVRVWNAMTGEALGELVGHTDTVAAVAWSPSGVTLASASHDYTVRTWEVVRLTEGSVLRGHLNWVNTLAWNPDGLQLASGSNDQSIRIWSLEQGRETHKFTGHTQGVKSLSWSPDGSHLASGSDDLSLRVWSRDGSQVFQAVGHTAPLTGVSWKPATSEIASASFDGSVKIWSASPDAEDSSPSKPYGNIEQLAWHPLDSTKLAIGWSEGVVEVRDRRTLDRTELRVVGSYLRSVSWGMDGTQIATGSADGLVRIWNLSIPTQPLKHLEHGAEVLTIAWAPTGRLLASAGTDRRVSVWDPSTGERRAWLVGHLQPVTTIAWDPVGELVATGARDGVIKVWRASTGNEICSYDQHHATIAALAWSPNRRDIASASINPIIHLWDSLSGELQELMHGHAVHPSQLCWSPDGHRLASAGRDGFMKIWDPKSGREVLSLELGGARLSGIAWSPDGLTIAVASEDGRARMIDAASGHLAALSPKVHAELVNRSLLTMKSDELLLRAKVQQAEFDWARAGETLDQYLRLSSRPWVVLDAYYSKPYAARTSGYGVRQFTETSLEIDVLDSAKFPSDASTWQKRDGTAEGVVDLTAYTHGRNDTSVFLLYPVYSDGDQAVTIRLGSDDGVRVWVNKVLVHEFSGSRSALPDQDSIPSMLEKGWNWFVFEVVNHSGDHGLRFRLAPSGLPEPKADSATALRLVRDLDPRGDK